MARPREHLRNAPIVEALVDYRVLPREGISIDRFAALQDSVGAHYNVRQPLQSFEARFGFEEGRPVGPTQTALPVGWLYQSTASATIAQFRIDGFTFSKLELYSSWGEGFGE